MRVRATVLIGREPELELLSQALTSAKADKGRAIFLVGEPGIGKSRLALEAENRAGASGTRVMRGRGTTIGPTVPFRPLTEALLSLSRVGDLPEAVDLGRYLPALGQLVPDWSHGPAQRDAEPLIILAEAVLRLMRALGRRGGCVMILDDLQDADPETLAVIEYLIDNLDHQPAVLVGTIRSGPGAAFELARSAAQRGVCTLVELGRLNREQVSQLVRSCLPALPGEIPEAIMERLWVDGAGNPFVVEELLNGMMASRLLVPTRKGWRTTGAIRRQMPTTLARTVASRADQLGRPASRMLCVAAALGARFPLEVVQAVTGLDDRTTQHHVQAALDAQLITTEDQPPDWYRFHHPLAADALLLRLTPTDRADIARRAANVIEQLHPALPGEWCQLAAAMRVDAGDAAAAGLLLAEAGRRAVAHGGTHSAIALLDRAWELLPGDADIDVRAEVLESLLYALVEAGQVERALTWARSLDEAYCRGLDGRRRAALHTRIAWAASVAGRPGEGLAQVEQARVLLGPQARTEDLAPVDAVTAYLMLDTPGRGRMRAAEDLARRTAAIAESVPLPVVACQAWQLVGELALRRDLDESTGYFERTRSLAEEHQLPVWQIHALIRLGGNEALAYGDLNRLRQARDAAARAGAVTASYDAEVRLAFHLVLQGDFADAASSIERYLPAVQRLRLDGTAQQLLLARAVLAAHQGKRREMDEALAEFSQWGGARSRQHPLVHSLARSFCALLEEDLPQARAEVAQAHSLTGEHPTIFHLAGGDGLGLFLDFLTDGGDWARYGRAAATPVGRLRWNRQFVSLARAALLGRSGRADEALVALAQAKEAAAPYPVAWHLGLRLLAVAAGRDGWGTPQAWLQESEFYFHNAGVPAVAAACRFHLRQLGASVPQRRTGSERIPRPLRVMGVTSREYEVLELLVDRLSNQAIASRLYISPRTAEKHVASLIAKTGQPGRSALCAAAPAMLGD